jgi:2,3-bisphosphoglycerate-dependent phosphoglycerate mutase
MRIFLVRHGQSRSNEDWTENQRVADHAIELTEEGHEQARKCGLRLLPFLAPEGTNVIDKIRLWHSPYRRTRQTAARIEETCRLIHRVNIFDSTGPHSNIGREAGESVFFDKREHLLLSEQQFGLFDGLSDDEREKQFPREHGYYQKYKAFEGKMWPKMPQGESRFEVCQRVHQAFGTFHRDAVKHGIKTIVVVGHGTTNRAFIQMWLHKPWEWMHQEPNPHNCSVRLIEDGEDKGYIFDGFDHATDDD